MKIFYITLIFFLFLKLNAEENIIEILFISTHTLQKIDIGYYTKKIVKQI